MNAIDGFVKILTNTKTDKVLGAHIVGPEAGALIVVLTKTNPSAIGKNEVFRAGMIAVVAAATSAHFAIRRGDGPAWRLGARWP